MKTVYQTDANGYYVGPVEADESPLEPGVYLIPAGCSETAPPNTGANQIARRVNGAWQIKADYRGTVYWLSDGSRHEITDLDVTPPPGALWADPGPSLASLKAAKHKQIERERDAACYADINVNGHAWQADPRSQSLMATTILLAQAGVYTPSVWRTADNVDVPITLPALVMIAGSIAAQTQAAYAASWTRKAALEAAMTAEEVAGV